MTDERLPFLPLYWEPRTSRGICTRGGPSILGGYFRWRGCRRTRLWRMARGKRAPWAAEGARGGSTHCPPQSGCADASGATTASSTLPPASLGRFHPSSTTSTPTPLARGVRPLLKPYTNSTLQADGGWPAQRRVAVLCNPPNVCKARCCRPVLLEKWR